MKNNKLRFSTYSLQSFVSIKSSGKSKKPRGQENNLVEKWEPIDSSDSWRHRAAEQLSEVSMKPGTKFARGCTTGQFKDGGPASKKCRENLGGVGGDSTGRS